jgi:ribosomal protein S6
LYALPTAAGAQQVVRLYCALDPYAMVMMPSGKLKVVELSKMKPTSDPFVAATQDEIIDSFKASRFSKYKFEKGKYGYLYVYDCSDAFFAHAQSILESMLPGVVGSLKSWGMTVKRPDVPMVVVIVPSRAAYDAIMPMPKEVIAYYNMNSNQIVMYEDQEMWDAAPEFAAKQAAYCIAHEGVHQLLGNIGIQQRLSGWAPWICEGLPEYYCPVKVNSKIVAKGNSELPARTLKWNKAGMVNDLRMWSLLKMPTSSGKALESLVTAREIDANGYALAWGLVHYLATKKSEAFQAYLTDVSKYEPLDPKTQPLTGRSDPLFVKHFGSDFAALEKEIQEYLTSKSMQAEYIDPIENQTHYLVKAIKKVGHGHGVLYGITVSPVAAKNFKEKLEATDKQLHFYTVAYKTRGEAERAKAKLEALAGK